MNKRWANLFILGAPKCGTTALATWLSEHSEITVSSPKEPHYFSTEHQSITDEQTYLSLFGEEESSAKWLCDASVWHLFSDDAVKNILALKNDAKFVVMLRNPAEIVISMHRHQVYNGNELIHDLSQALDLNDLRLSGDGQGVLSSYPSERLAYFHSCALGWQLERLLTLVDRDRVHLIFMDDIKQDSKAVLKRLFEFLEVGEEYPTKLEKINVAKERKFQHFDRVVKRIGDLKHRSGIKMKFGFLAWLRKINQKPATLGVVTSGTHIRIANEFVEDTKLIERFSERDLSNWNV